MKKLVAIAAVASLALVIGESATAQLKPCPPMRFSAGNGPNGNTVCLNDIEDWQSRSTAAGVFYANNFNYNNRNEYLDAAHSTQYRETSNGVPKLDLETSIKLTGNGASRHNWIAAEGANEAGPAWNYSFDGPGAKTTNTKKTEFYLQYSMYVDQGWVDFTYNDGSIKTQIIFNPAVPPFAQGEIVQTRRGRGPWPGGFRVTNTAQGYQLLWPGGDDTYYTFWDGGPQSENGETDETSRDLFERRYGPRRRNQDRTDPDYANVPQLRGGRWYTFETYVRIGNGENVVKNWFSERGQPPILLYGLMDAGMREDEDTYRGAHLINRAENTTVWIDTDTFIIFDEVIVSDNPINFPGGYTLPNPGGETPAGWPWADSQPRN